MALSRNALAKKGNRNLKAVKALANVKQESLHPTLEGTGFCLRDVRKQYGIDAGSPTAIAAWNAAGNKNTHTWYDAPAGVPVFWSGGSTGAGHIAIADGLGNVWSTDIRREGKFDLVPLAEIHNKWGLKYLGWTNTLNGVLVYEA